MLLFFNIKLQYIKTGLAICKLEIDPLSILLIYFVQLLIYFIIHSKSITNEKNKPPTLRVLLLD